MPQSHTNTRDGKVFISAELDSEVALMVQVEAAQTPGGMDALLETFAREAVKALKTFN